MLTISKSSKTYWGLVVVLSLFAGLNVLFVSAPAEAFPAPKPVLALVSTAITLIIYGVLGLIGLKLSRKINFADIWQDNVSNKQRFLIPAEIGLIVGLFFILTDMLVSQFHSLGAMPHPSFPLSIVASITAGIGEEIIFRLFFISFWTWLISYVIFKKQYVNQVFWIVSGLSAVLFAVGHIPSVMAILGLTTINQIPPVLMGELIFLNVLVSLPAAYSFRRFGFLAAVGIHFWTDIIWHVIYGLF